MNAITLTIPRLSADGFLELCKANQDLQLELTATGEVIIMPPTFSWTGKQNSGLNAQLWNWNDKTGLGTVFDSSTGFTLPNGAIRSPDASWVSNERWEALTEIQQKEEFSPLSPDFVVELRSSSDSLKKLREKMQEYIDNGVRLGWLIDTTKKQVEIYRPGRTVEVVESPTMLSGEEVLPEFVLNLKKVW
ncbi:MULTISPECIES: Uma2 family endonuclease [unclassified Coleofasciculus]|uniref:Uma2 family endonuclease n=1 Tax=unclassified Coleofasciculus TaxID=2692782 RepID=UPI001880D39E|nr:MULTISPECIES: Uma2 family endonuclease [unclassified Coleofasciculus]MBE9126193.1 Uma2 family endonuclease [Coleofasciculus sp. LEGE 07081]MBE9149600.1 Uma2 family endonuclease [Coleofasciculus sp. LEGE 07092]